MNKLKIISALLLVCILCISIYSCENAIVTTSADSTNYNIQPAFYSDNHYFIDTIYKTAFRRIFTEGNNNYTDSNGIDVTNLQIWVQTEVTNPNKRSAVLDIDLPQVYTGEQYDTIPYMIDQNIPSKRMGAYFRKLASSEYSIDYDAGFISLKVNLPDLYGAGLTYQYRNNPNKKVGIGDNSVGATNTLLLKMVKLPDLTPTDTLAWALKMKNVYRLPVNNIVRENFTLLVNYIDPATNIGSPTLPSGRNLLQIQKLDRFTGSNFGQYAPDNNFDYIEGRTVLSSSGDIIFPSLEPFSSDISADPRDSNYAFSDIYKYSKSVAIQSPRNSFYVIKGHVRGVGGYY